MCLRCGSVTVWRTDRRGNVANLCALIAHPNVQLGCPITPDPYAASAPQPDPGACNYSSMNLNGGTHTLWPGTYCGWININNADVNFEPGLYVIKDGGWNINGGEWNGNGVSFYFADTSVFQFNSAVKAKLTPPESGTYKGWMFFEKLGLPKSSFVFDDSRDFDIEGLMYLPSRNVTFNSGSQLRSRTLTLVTNSMILNQVNWNLASETMTGLGGTGSGNVIAYLEN